MSFTNSVYEGSLYSLVLKIRSYCTVSYRNSRELMQHGKRQLFSTYPRIVGGCSGSLTRNSLFSSSRSMEDSSNWLSPLRALEGGRGGLRCLMAMLVCEGAS
jgi:hypothetical protein